MKIALVGYGKMGHMIEQAAKRAGHEVVTTIDVIADDAKVKVDVHLLAEQYPAIAPGVCRRSWLCARRGLC